MKAIQALVLGSLVLGVQSFAGSVSCVSDYRAVDGGLVKFNLTIENDGHGIATIYEESNSPAASNSENTELRALECKIDKGPFVGVTCTGPYQLSISDMELAPPPGGQFSHLFNVSTTFKDKAFTFGRRVNAPMKDECEFNL